MEKTMPESFPVWFPWLLSALTGGLSAAIYNSFANWRRSKKDAEKAQIAQIEALRQELLHALSIIEYNHDRVLSEGMPHKGLTGVVTINVERVLFGAMPSLRFQPNVLDQLRNYLREVVYLNSLITEQASLVPSSVSNVAVETRLRDYMAEIKAICTRADTFRENDPEPSLRIKAKRIVEQLDKIKL